MSEKFKRLTLPINDDSDTANCTIHFTCTTCNTNLTVPNQRFIDCSEYKRLKALESENGRLNNFEAGYRALKGIVERATLMTKAESDRLKQVDENINKKIAELKEIDGESTPSALTKLLESLRG
jgi:hypothetical protein